MYSPDHIRITKTEGWSGGGGDITSYVLKKVIFILQLFKQGNFPQNNKQFPPSFGAFIKQN